MTRIEVVDWFWEMLSMDGNADAAVTAKMGSEAYYHHPFPAPLIILLHSLQIEDSSFFLQNFHICHHHRQHASAALL